MSLPVFDAISVFVSDQPKHFQSALELPEVYFLALHQKSFSASVLSSEISVNI